MFVIIYKYKYLIKILTVVETLNFLFRQNILKCKIKCNNKTKILQFGNSPNFIFLKLKFN